MCSPAKISRLETGDRGAHVRDVRDLCLLYRAPDAVRDELISLATEAKRPGWWRAFRSLDDAVMTFIGLESAASEVLNFDPLRIPGPLQTSEYTTALLTSIGRARALDPAWIRETVEVRKLRQLRYRESDIALRAVLDEAALRRCVGGAEVMTRQIDRLLEDAERPLVELQVVPCSAGAYPGLEGAFTHLTFTSAFLSNVVYIEGPPVHCFFDKPAVTDHYKRVFNSISIESALSAADSRALLCDLRADIRKGRLGRCDTVIDAV